MSTDEYSTFLKRLCSERAHGDDDLIESWLSQNESFARHDLYCACAMGEHEHVEELLLADPTLATTPGGPNNWPPILYTCYSHFARPDHKREPDIRKLVDRMLELGADPNSKFTWFGKADLSALYGAAAIRGNQGIVEILLHNGAHANDGYSLLHCCRQKKFDCALALIHAGADPNNTDHHTSFPPLHWLLDWDSDTEVIKWLIEHGADPSFPAGPLWEAPLHVAIRRRRIDEVNLLLQKGANKDAKTLGGLTPYAHGRRRGFEEVTTLLEDFGCDTTLSPIDNLAIAVFTGKLDDARKILEEDAIVASKFRPEDARMLPDSAARPESISFLLEAGVPIDSRGMDGGTALHQAAWFGFVDSTRLLIDQGASIDITGDDHDSTPLGWACHGSRYSQDASARSAAYAEIAKMLLDAGASLASTINPDGDPHGRWLLSEASEEVADILRANGAKD